MENDRIAELELRLDDFDPQVRRGALEELAAGKDKGEIQPAPGRGWFNLHVHTFFSFNACGYSPSHIAWRAWREGLDPVASVDFDALDAVEEMLAAGDRLDLKTLAGLETRVFIRDFPDVIFNSPKEPGVYYLNALGFTRPPEPDSPAGKILNKMQRLARSRNETMLGKINDYLAPVRLDYEQDVLPLTPAGNATERHLLEAYDTQARRQFPDEADLARFWADRLETQSDDIKPLLTDTPALHDLIRAKLMKYGGIGYATPEAGSFPTLEEAVEMIRACGAIPLMSYLDGENEGEKDMVKNITYFHKKGCNGTVVIPERNWNLADPQEKARKLAHLAYTVKTAQNLNIPLVIGTEMNKASQRFVDAFDTAELAPYFDVFRQDALNIYARASGQGKKGKEKNV